MKFDVFWGKSIGKVCPRKTFILIIQMIGLSLDLPKDLIDYKVNIFRLKIQIINEFFCKANDCKYYSSPRKQSQQFGPKGLGV